MLELDNVSAGYRAEVSVVQNISFTVASGTAVGLIGRNGAGKTCLAEAVIGSLPLVSGSVTVDGVDLSSMKTGGRVRSRLALVPEGRLIFGQLTVRENLEMAAFGAGRKLTKPDVIMVEELFPTLARKRDDAAATMSGGEQQWLAIARALVQNPAAIVLDEPSLGLSPVAIDQLTIALKEIRDGGVALVLMEQNPHLLEELCGVTLLLDQGKISTTVDLSSASGGALVERAYLGG
jgi:branched-chain amino acid transport system ATP-binding protein